MSKTVIDFTGSQSIAVAREAFVDSNQIMHTLTMRILA